VLGTVGAHDHSLLTLLAAANYLGQAYADAEALVAAGGKGRVRNEYHWTISIHGQGQLPPRADRTRCGSGRGGRKTNFIGG
jgi:hypothetical protein